MHTVTRDGDPYETFAPSEAITEGMIVLLPNGKAGEVILAPMPNGWMLARPWDASDAFHYHVDSIHPYVEIGA